MTDESEIAKQWQREMPGQSAEDQALLDFMRGDPTEAWLRDFERLFDTGRRRNRAKQQHPIVTPVGWYNIGYPPEEAKLWVDAGADLHEHELVADLVEQGINPRRAQEMIVHPRTSQKMTILSFARSYHLHFATLGKALDAASVVRTLAWRPGRLFGRRLVPPSIDWPDTA